MELVGTIEKKFSVDGNTMKVALTLTASKENLAFIHDVAGMRCDIYVDARAPEPEAKDPDDTTGDLFNQNGEPIDGDEEVPTEAGDNEGSDDYPEMCAHNFPVGECQLCDGEEAPVGEPVTVAEDGEQS